MNGHTAPGWICATCGNHYPPAPVPPAQCLICSDERQWVPPSGQRWTTLDELATAGHASEVRDVEPGLIGIGTAPAFAIGQRALLVTTEAGNLLWEPSGFIDTAAISAVRDAGGLAAVSASHPHLYGALVEWADAFDADIVLPEADAGWLTRPAPVRAWSHALEVLPGVTLIQCGGHFPGSAVVHWANGAGGAGVLLSGVTKIVSPGEDRVTFVGSAPNRLPLPERAVRHIVGAVASYRFDRIYGAWWEPVIRRDARRIVEASAERYIAWLRGDALQD